MIDASRHRAPQRGRATTAREIETCARCHARRGQIADDYVAGQPLLRHAIGLALLEPGLYYADGQMRDEVYNYGSFLQSRMYARGVTCTDCHDPHSAKLRAPGNASARSATCRAKFDAPAHHSPCRVDRRGVRGCHMPAATYMVVDPRHDHSLRVPRPDLSVALGTPNACTDCHADRKAAVGGRRGGEVVRTTPGGYQAFGEAFAAALRHGSGRAVAAHEDRRRLDAAGDRSRRGARAARVRPDAGRDRARVERVERSRRAGAPERGRCAVRRGSRRAAALPPAHARRSGARVRIAAARSLAALPSERIPADRRASFDRALDEYLAAQRFNADRPEGHSNLGALHAERGELEKAEAEYRRALELAPEAVQPAVNLADLYRRRGDEERAAEVLRSALKTNPAAAPLDHALGLTYARQKRRAETLAELAEAVRLRPM